MFFWEWVIQSISRSRLRSLLLFIFPLLLVGFLGLYEQSINKNTKYLDSLYEQTEVKMLLLRDKVPEALNINKNDLTELENSGFIDKYNYKTRLLFELVQENVEPWKSIFNDTYLVGDMKYDLKDDECSVGFTFANNNNLNVGDKINVYVSLTKTKNIELEFTIKEVQYEVQYGIICSFEKAESICKELDSGIMIYSAEYLLRNKKHLDQFRSFLMNTELRKLNWGLEYLILDEQLNKIVTPIKNTIQFMKYLLPVLYLLLGAIGFFISYLANHAEKRTLFLLFAMGVRKRTQFAYLFFKQILLITVGNLAGLLLLSLDKVLLCFLFYSIGITLSAFILIQKTKKRNLAEKE